MKLLSAGIVCLFAVTAIFAVAFCRTASPSARLEAMPAQSSRTVPVLVELFTSEGCSSCPPADKVLETLQAAQPVEGADIIVLGEHVDYWNRLGWPDPFSSAQFSERQAEYARRLGGGVYTPQMVVDGRFEFVGGSRAKALNTVAEAARTPKTEVRIVRADTRDETLRLRIEVGRLASDADLLVAVTEDGLESQVPRGENAGRRLDHVGVVRVMKRIGRLDADKSPSFADEVSLPISSKWRRERLRVVAFVQTHSDLRVAGVAALKLSAP